MISNAIAKLNSGSHQTWKRFIAACISAAALAAAPAGAQGVETFDPDEAFASAASEPRASSQQDGGAIDADLVQPELATAPSSAGTNPSPAPNPASSPQPVPVGAGGPAVVETTGPRSSVFDDEFSTYSQGGESAATPEIAPAIDPNAAVPEEVQSQTTYGQDDLIGAAEGVFGKGAEGLGRMIEDLLKEQGEPNGYIVGREAGGAFIFGARYGSGTLFHKVEGEKKVYWTGPSIGFDAGANAAKTFVLVYNLFDTEELFKRYPAGEGQAYLIGGLHASYMRKGDVVLIPIRMGAGVRLGLNAGYMKFSKKQRWLPF